MTNQLIERTDQMLISLPKIHRFKSIEKAPSYGDRLATYKFIGEDGLLTYQVFCKELPQGLIDTMKTYYVSIKDTIVHEFIVNGKTQRFEYKGLLK